MSGSNFALLAGPSSINFARSMARQIECEIVDFEFKEFPDGENYFRIISDVKGKNVLIVQSLYPPVDHHLVQLLFLSKKVTELGGFVYAICPYLGYSRQHREYLSGEVVSLKTVGHLMASVGVRRLLTIDIHNVEGLGLFPFPAFSVSAIPIMAEWVQKNEDLSDAIIVSPDFGSSTRVETFSKLVNRQYHVFEKERDKVTGEVKIKPIQLELEGKKAYIVDDMISSGGTVIKATKTLKEFGVKKVIAVCVHPVLAAGAVEKMFEAGVNKIIASNTIENKYGIVDVSNAVVGYLKLLG
ncbi:MAG: ribose-phosphate pyrophosphokinase [Nitrososphaeria archaeon]|nr:ribose-phosphate pyrophosphokinase [Nitrososphaeria archaeon]